MRSDNNSSGQDSSRTFTDTARRAQILDAAIDTIAELGYGQASLARMAERAGTSKGVILYHFDGKDEIVREIVRGLVKKTVERISPLVTAAPDGRAALRAVIEGNLAVIRDNPNHVIAVVEIAVSNRHLYQATTAAKGESDMRELLEYFQRTGEFRPDFDASVMAIMIRAAIDAVPARIGRDPDFDIDHYAHELADLFDLATRSNPSVQSVPEQEKS